MDDFNDVIALLLDELPNRTATSSSLAAQIENRDLWRCPIDRTHPAAWHIEVWVRSPHAGGRFVLGKGVVAYRGGAAAAGQAAVCLRKTG